MTPFFLSLFLLSLLPFTAHSADSFDDFLQDFNPQKKEYKLKYELNSSQNKNLFNKYCKGNVNSHKPPEPRYSNFLVKKAAKNIAATDRRAKRVLEERALERMEQDMERAAEQAEELKNTSQNSTVKEKATNLYNQIIAGSVFTDSMEKKSIEISKEITKEIKPIVDELVIKLDADLKGIDNHNFKNAVNEFHDALEGELEKVSFIKLEEANKKLKQAYQAKLGTADKEKIEELAKKISKEVDISLETNPDDWNFKYMKESTDMLATEVNQNGLTQETYYSMTSILANYDYEGMEHTANSIAYGKELGAQLPAVRAEEIIKRSEALIAILAEADENNAEDVRSASSASSYIRSEIRSIEVWAGAELVVVHEAFKAENIKFQTNNILSQTGDAKNKANANPENWPVAHQAARRYEYTLERMKEVISEATYAHFLTVQMELKKLDADMIKQSAKDVQSLLIGIVDIEEEQRWSVQSLANYMERELGLTTAKSAADKLVFYGSSMRSIQEIKRLAKTRVEDAKPGMHYYFYGHVWKHYKEDGQKPSAVTWNAHKFLKQLCGEYRDRATMIEAKVKWVANGLFILPKEEDAGSSVITAQTKNVWSKMNASWYRPYLNVTEALWNARRDGQDRYIKVGTYGVNDARRVDNPVKGTTVCETKFVFAHYVSQEKRFDSLEDFNEAYDDFKGGCPVADRNDYYDFRGDSNFKHYSPESNGMIWYANNLSRACRSTSRIKSSTKNYKNSDCQKYFKNPFQMRYAGARALFASWLFRAPEHDEVFGNSGSMVSLYSHRDPQLAPYSFGFDQNTLNYHFQFDPDWAGIPLENGWLKGDMGYNEYTGLADGVNASEEAKTKAFTLISNAVDRHTDWYASGYNDGNGFVRDQATSPFVASSYVMSSSDAFTTCGITVQCPPDGLKRWMFVFRIKGDNWYGPDRIEKGEAIDFDRHWFDETSFGFTSLADSEHAWDRLGTALEEELDSILYLVNVNEDGFHGEEN